MSQHRSAVALFALLAAQGVRAKEFSTEVGAATVWFALLVVVFALLVSVGLYLARDHDDAHDDQAHAPPPSLRPSDLRAARRRAAHPSHKQQEFS